MTRLIISFRLTTVRFYSVINGTKDLLETMPYQRDFVYSDEKKRIERKYKLKFDGVINDYESAGIE